MEVSPAQSVLGGTWGSVIYLFHVSLEHSKQTINIKLSMLLIQPQFCSLLKRMLRKQAHRTEVKNSEIMTFYPLIHHLFQLIKPLPYYHIILFLFFSLHNITHKFTWIKKRTWWSNFVSSNLNAYEQRAYHHCNRHRPRVHPIPFTFTRL